jgi:septum formation protein
MAPFSFEESNIMKNIDDILLASQSKFRLAICESAGIPVRGVKSYCDEDKVIDENPAQLAIKRSEAKGKEVKDIKVNSLVISSDQVLEFEAKPYGKAKDEKEAFERLMQFAGNTHYLHTAYSLFFYEKDKEPVLIGNHLVSVEMKMRDFSKEVAKNYIATGEWQGCAGCYQFENKGAHLFDSAKGESTAIIGLPVLDLLAKLRNLGIDLMENQKGPWALKLT